MLHQNLSVNSKGELCIGGLSTKELADKYKIPLYIMDENKVRDNMRAFNEEFIDVITSSEKVNISYKGRDNNDNLIV